MYIKKELGRNSSSSSMNEWERQSRGEKGRSDEDQPLAIHH